MYASGGRCDPPLEELELLDDELELDEELEEELLELELELLDEEEELDEELLDDELDDQPDDVKPDELMPEEPELEDPPHKADEKIIITTRKIFVNRCIANSLQLLAWQDQFYHQTRPKGRPHIPYGTLKKSTFCQIASASSQITPGTKRYRTSFS